jgi:hypothetical protein
VDKHERLEWMLNAGLIDTGEAIALQDYSEREIAMVQRERQAEQEAAASKRCHTCGGLGYTTTGGLCTCQAAHDLCDAQVLAEATWDN